MENSVYEINEDELMIDDYYDIGFVEELIIFDSWLEDDGLLGNWARHQMENDRWQKTREVGMMLSWTRLSKLPA